MSSSQELKSNNIKKGGLVVGTLNANGKQPLEQIAVKTMVQVLNGGIKTWDIPNSFATNSLSTDGTDGPGAEIPYNATYHSQTNNITAGGWWNSSANEAFGTIFNHGGSGAVDARKWTIGWENGKFSAIVNANGAGTISKYYRTVATYNDGEWHHVAFTFTTNSLTLYVDGVAVIGGALDPVTNGTVNTLSSSTEKLGLNTYHNGAGSTRLSANGFGAHFAYWDKELSASEITEWYNLNRPWDITAHSAAANLISWYRVDGSNGTTIADEVNGQTATLVGTASISSNAPASGGDFTFDAALNLLIPGLLPADNNIPTSESPLSFLNNNDVAYVVPNLASGGGNLTVIIDTANNVPDNAVIIAVRDGTELILGTRSV